MISSAVTSRTVKKVSTTYVKNDKLEGSALNEPPMAMCIQDTFT
jgi:hypothetical protein